MLPILDPKSLKNLKLDTVDVLYLQNGYEAWGPHLKEDEWNAKLAKFCEFAESQIQEGKIRSYGLATYSSLRKKQGEKANHMNLQKAI